MAVSLARYGKGGVPFVKRYSIPSHREQRKRSGIMYPSLRDSRKYVDVVWGQRTTVQLHQGKVSTPAMAWKEKSIPSTGKKKGNDSWCEESNKNGARNIRKHGDEGDPKDTGSRPSKNRKEDGNSKVSNINQVIVNINENPVMAYRMKLAVIVDLEQPYDVEKIASLCAENHLEADYISSITPYKMAIFFKDEKSIKVALEDNSPLKNIYTDARKWSENERCMERLAWVECIGIHPTCWGFDTFKKIGNLWGDIVKMEHVMNGVRSLSSAKILIRTKHMKKIETDVILK